MENDKAHSKARKQFEETSKICHHHVLVRTRSAGNAPPATGDAGSAATAGTACRLLTKPDALFPCDLAAMLLGVYLKGPGDASTQNAAHGRLKQLYLEWPKSAQKFKSPRQRRALNKHTAIWKKENQAHPSLYTE